MFNHENSRQWNGNYLILRLLPFREGQTCTKAVQRNLHQHVHSCSFSFVLLTFLSFPFRSICRPSLPIAFTASFDKHLYYFLYCPTVLLQQFPTSFVSYDSYGLVLPDAIIFCIYFLLLDLFSSCCFPIFAKLLPLLTFYLHIFLSSIYSFPWQFLLFLLQHDHRLHLL